MGWDDRPYYRDRSAGGHVLARVLGVSAPMGRFLGVPIRAHASLVILLIGLLAIPMHLCPFSQRAIGCAMLVFVLLVHEFSHLAIARLTGGSGDEMLLWPLGGLEYPMLPRRTRGALLTIAAGPLSTAALCTAGGLGVCLLTPAAIVDPHNPAAATAAAVMVDFNPLHAFNPAPEGLTPNQAALYFWWLFSIAYLVFLANLLPIYPLDGGHLLQAMLTPKVGVNRATQITANTGALGGLALLATGAFSLNLLLATAGICAFLFCRERATEVRERISEGALPGTVDFGATLFAPPPPKSRRHLSRRAIKRARRIVQREAAERNYLDGILAKVSANGIASLTWRERRTLKKATALQRLRENELSNWKE